MLYYNRIDIIAGTDPTKSNKSKECMTTFYCFLNHGFKFQDSVCNGCHDLTVLCLNPKVPWYFCHAAYFDPK